jgi:ribosome-associated protein
MEDEKLEPPSKSSKKRDMHALQELGAELVDLNAEQLESMQLPDSLLAAVL